MFGFKGGGRMETLGANTTTTTAGTALVTAATSVITAGPWVTLGTPSFDYEGFTLIGQSFTPGGVGMRHIIDIALGSGDTTIVEGLYTDFRNNGEGFAVYVPVRIPAGIPVVARDTPSSTSAPFHVALTGAGGGFAVPRGATKLELFTGTSVTVDPGDVGHAKGAWTSITNGGTPSEYRGLMCSFHWVSVLGADMRWLIDLRVGASSSAPILSNYLFFGDAASDTLFNSMQPLYVAANIPAGSAVMARAQTNTSTLADRRLHTRIYGLKY